MSVTWIFIFCFIFFLALDAISFYILIRIKKDRYRNLWEKDSKSGTIWNPYERNLLVELAWRTPFWVEEEKDAKIWLWIYRGSMFLGFFSWIFFVLAKYKLIG